MTATTSQGSQQTPAAGAGAESGGGTAPAPLPHNRLGINYRAVPARRIEVPIIDVHTHTYNVEHTRGFLEAADAYGIREIWTMAPLEDVDAFQQHFPGRFHFIAVPKWQDAGPTEAFVTDWMKRLDGFYEKGSRLAKFHLSPGTRKRSGLDLNHPLLQRVVRHAYTLGFHFMTHVGDPKAWFAPRARYADVAQYGTFESQFEMLDRMLEQFPDRVHMGAHMGGSLEDLDALERRLERFPHYSLDSSATKWIVRAIAQQDPDRVRAFLIRQQNRVMFGSDLVVGDKYGFDHYASRYWTHLMQWESDIIGESPIEDPDAAEGRPQLRGLDLPESVLRKMYRENALGFLPWT